MTLLSKTPGLTRFEIDPITDQTHAGQAHFANTGPDGAQCDTCEFFRHKRSSKKGLFDRFLAGHCAKHTELMGGKGGPKFPATAPACRYYGDRS